MSKLSSFGRYCVSMHGYSGLSDDDLRRISLGVRFKPLLIALFLLVRRTVFRPGAQA